jgi:hypothetical protein
MKSGLYCVRNKGKKVTLLSKYSIERNNSILKCFVQNIPVRSLYTVQKELGVRLVSLIQREIILYMASAIHCEKWASRKNLFTDLLI